MRHETQRRQLICFSFAKEYGLKMKRQLIIERWWVWRFFHIRKLDDDLKEQYWNRKERKKWITKHSNRKWQRIWSRGFTREALRMLRWAFTMLKKQISTTNPWPCDRKEAMLESTSILRMPLLNTSTPEIMLVFLRNQQWKVWIYFELDRF